MRVSNSNLMIPITLRIKELLIMRKNLTEVKKLAKYKVQDVKEEDGVYTVSVQVEPSNVFQTLQQSSTEVSNEKIKQDWMEMIRKSLQLY